MQKTEEKASVSSSFVERSFSRQILKIIMSFATWSEFKSMSFDQTDRIWNPSSFWSKSKQFQFSHLKIMGSVTHTSTHKIVTMGSEIKQELSYFLLPILWFYLSYPQPLRQSFPIHHCSLVSLSIPSPCQWIWLDFLSHSRYVLGYKNTRSLSLL